MINQNSSTLDKLLQQAIAAGLSTKEAFVGKYLAGINEPEYDFRGFNLKETVFNGANLCNCQFSGCNLKDTEFRGCDLTGAKFLGANLSNSDFTGANLTHANFKGAVLYKTDFSDANITKVNFEGANVENADFKRNDGLNNDIRSKLKQQGAKIDGVGNLDSHKKGFTWWIRFAIVPLLVALLAHGYFKPPPSNNPEPSQNTTPTENPN